jgi:hypothetical protein
MAAVYVVGLGAVGLRLAAVAALLAATVSACSSGGAGRDETAASIARAAGLEAATVRGASFDLQTWRRDDGRPGPLFVYVEGDGLAYLDARTPSSDPTPSDPVALRLAAADPGPAVLYIARPCQFAAGRADARCGVRDWTTGRFGVEVVASIDDVISRARAAHPERALVLVGYSGGGVIAALVAARRRDVALLVTVAAPLDVADWTRRMGVSPLDGAALPLDRLPAVTTVAFAGGQDKVVPVASVASAVGKLGASATLIVEPGFDHRCCWARDWPGLRATALKARRAGPEN